MSKHQSRDANASLPVQVMQSDAKEDGPPDSKLERRTVNKLDLILVPTMSLLYLLAFLDRWEMRCEKAGLTVMLTESTDPTLATPA
jgi:hypothetical protein